MFSIVITERGGAQRLLDFDAQEVSIGRLEDNDVVLPRSNVSKRHARLVLKDDRCVLIDMKSTNGTYLNGRKISAPMMVGAGDKIYIGDFILALQDSPRPRPGPARLRERVPTQPVSSLRPSLSADPLPEPGLGAPAGAAAAAPPPRRPPTPPPRMHPAGQVDLQAAWPAPLSVFAGRSSSPPKPAAPPPAELLTAIEETRITADAPPGIADEAHAGAAPAQESSPPPRAQELEGGGPATSPAVLAPSVRLQGALQTLMERLAARMDLTEPHERAFPAEHKDTLEALIAELAETGVIGPDLDRRFLTQAAISEAVGLGPLDRLLTNRSVREVVVDGPSRVLADLGGGLSPVSSFFSSLSAVHVALRRLYARAGKEPSGAPADELELPDGSQALVLLPPLSPAGPLLSIRCPPQTPVVPDGLITEGALSGEMLQLLRAAVQRRLNTLVVGPVGGGVSTLLSAVASLCQDHERIVAVQRAPSLAIRHPQVLSLHHAGAHGKELSLLLRRAMRLRGDRLVVDDVQGEDALYVLTCAAAARGVFAGMHAASSAAALQQLEMFAQVALSGARAPLAALIAQAFQLIVEVSADGGGARRVLGIAELRGAGDNSLELTPLYRYDDGFKATAARPSFL